MGIKNDDTGSMIPPPSAVLFLFPQPDICAGECGKDVDQRTSCLLHKHKDGGRKQDSRAPVYSQRLTRTMKRGSDSWG
ncbi:hypothetical protein CHS0354_012707 [Potamilus streckersoni]|uniref:Uncharacterized protein n=1 Tax=Potamilus streckersoni TaxID=2493646 RepID=A0AAE0W2V0_9BIVA|nr:hypothetical protein CHS0354_012707 [Potamilus streckersoni]